jgi:hypothetical protein
MWLRPVEYTDEQSAYFAALGRGISLAQNFEHSFKFVFGTLDLDKAYEENKLVAGGEWRAYAKKLMARSIGTALTARRKDPWFSDEEFTVLENARIARNYLAHQAAEAGLYIPPKSGKRKLREIILATADTAGIEKERKEMLVTFMSEALLPFEGAVRAIAEADNMVSGWSYMIQPQKCANEFRFGPAADAFSERKADA